MDKFTNIIAEFDRELIDLKKEYIKIKKFKRHKIYFEIILVITILVILAQFYILAVESFFIAFFVLIGVVILVKSVKVDKKQSYFGDLLFTSNEEIKYAEMVLVNRIDYILDIKELFSTGSLSETDLTNTKQYILENKTKLKKR